MHFKPGDKVRVKSKEEVKKLGVLREKNRKATAGFVSKLKFDGVITLGQYHESTDWWEADEGYSYDTEWLVSLHDTKALRGEKLNTYKFRDKEINFEKLCIDAIDDDACCFLVIGDKTCYQGFRVYSAKSYTFFNDINGRHLRDSYGYEIFECPITSTNDLILASKEFSKDYENWKEGLDKEIKSRDRKKDPKDLKTYKVMQF